MAHFDKNGYAVRSDGTQFERTNDGVIIASEQEANELFKSLRCNKLIEQQVNDLIEPEKWIGLHLIMSPSWQT